MVWNLSYGAKSREIRPLTFWALTRVYIGKDKTNEEDMDKYETKAIWCRNRSKFKLW